MFTGELGKKIMIQQGYVPATCTLPVKLAAPLIWSEINAGRDVCAGCEANRTVCKGRPKQTNTIGQSRLARKETSSGEHVVKLKNGEPCTHPGCASHFLHPCEVCGRLAAHGEVTMRLSILSGDMGTSAPGVDESPRMTDVEKMVRLGVEFLTQNPASVLVSVTSGRLRDLLLNSMKQRQEFVVSRRDYLVKSRVEMPDGIPPATWCVYGYEPHGLEGFHSPTFVWPDGRKITAPLMFMIDEVVGVSEAIVERACADVLVVFRVSGEVSVVRDELGFVNGVLANCEG